MTRAYKIIIKQVAIKFQKSCIHFDMDTASSTFITRRQPCYVDRFGSRKNAYEPSYIHRREKESCDINRSVPQQTPFTRLH